MSTGSGLGREPSLGDVEELALSTFTERSTDRGQPEEGSLGGELGAAGSGDPRIAAKAEDLHPYIISEALPVVPGKLVRRILSGEYVDMAELLKDTVEAERRRLLSGESRSGQRLGRREVPDSRAGCNVSVPMQWWYAASTPTRRGSCGPTRLS